MARCVPSISQIVSVSLLDRVVAGVTGFPSPHEHETRCSDDLDLIFAL